MARKIRKETLAERVEREALLRHGYCQCRDGERPYVVAHWHINTLCSRCRVRILEWPAHVLRVAEACA